MAGFACGVVYGAERSVRMADRIPSGHHRRDDEEAGRRLRGICECGWRGPWRSGRLMAYTDWLVHLRRIVGR